MAFHLAVSNVCSVSYNTTAKSLPANRRKLSFLIDVIRTSCCAKSSDGAEIMFIVLYAYQQQTIKYYVSACILPNWSSTAQAKISYNVTHFKWFVFENNSRIQLVMFIHINTHTHTTHRRGLGNIVNIIQLHINYVSSDNHELQKAKRTKQPFYSIRISLWMCNAMITCYILCYGPIYMLVCLSVCLSQVKVLPK